VKTAEKEFAVVVAQTMEDLGPAVVQAVGQIVTVDSQLIKDTIERARLAPHGRARVLLHPNRDDSLHEMLIALPRTSCDVPHINFKSGKSFHIVEGKMALMTFSPDGRRVTAHVLASSDAEGGRMARLNTPYWHTIIPLTDYAVFIETIMGPFVGNRFAPWVPAKDSAQWQEFVSELRVSAVSRNGDAVEQSLYTTGR